MKFFKTICLVIVLFSMAFAQWTANHTDSISQMSLDEIEVLSQDETGCPCPVVDCPKGGPGTHFCESDPGFYPSLGGFGGTCSVSCNQGYYACCGATCRCIPDGH